MAPNRGLRGGAQTVRRHSASDWSALVVCVLLVAGTTAVAASPAVAAATSPPMESHFSFSGSATPAFAGDAPDPDVVYSAGTYYAFTTGTTLGNNLQALIDTSGTPASGWRSYSGTEYGSTALPTPPAWEEANSQTSPGVFFYGGHWVMFYDASRNGHPEDSGYSCLSVATTSALTPSDPTFSDTSSGPLYCGTPSVGVLDPSPFVDPASGVAYLLWKSNDGSSSTASQIWSAQLSGNGTAIVGTPTVLLTVDQPAHPWETTTDDPRHGVRRRRLRPLVLRRGLPEHDLRRSADHLCRPPRSLRPTGGAVPCDLRVRLRPGRRCALPRCRRQLVAGLRRMGTGMRRILRRGRAPALRGPHRPQQRSGRPLPPTPRGNGRLPDGGR